MMEAVELVERRQEANRLEQDLVDAHQQGGAAAAPPKGTQYFDTDTSAQESGDKQTPGVKPLFMEAKRGRAMRFALRMLEQISRYPLPCSKKGKGIFIFYFTRLCSGRERVIRQCVSVCGYVHIIVPASFFASFRLFYLQSVDFLKFPRSNKTFSVSFLFLFPIPGVFFCNPPMPPPPVFL